jgi:hypothetical protein
MMQLVVFYHVMELIFSQDVYSTGVFTEVLHTVVKGSRNICRFFGSVAAIAGEEHGYF